MGPYCFLSYVLAVVFCFACSGDVFAQAQGQQGLIRVKGSNAMARLCDGWGAQFSSERPGTTVVISGGGAAYGFDCLFDKSADLVMSSRKILPKEIQAAVLSDTRPGEAEVCSDMIAMITHPDNPVKELTLEQLGKILRGQIQNWREVGGPDEAITVITGVQHEGTAAFLRQVVMEDDYFPTEAKGREFYHHIIREVSRKKPASLAYAPFQDAMLGEKSNLVRIIGLKKDESSPAVYPSYERLKNRTYHLIMPLYFYWSEATVTPVVKAFVEFCKNRCEANR